MTTTTAAGANNNAGLEATTGAMYDMLTNVAFMLITNQVIKYFNLTDPAYLLYVRVGFAATHALILMFLFALKMRIQKTAPKGGAVEIVEPSQVPGQTAPTKRILTVCEYDLLELSKQTKGIVTGFLFSAGLHYFLKSNHVLIISSVNMIRAQFAFPLVKLYLFGQKAEGLLQRPFKAPPSPFGELFSQLVQPQQQPAATTVTATKDDDSSSDDDAPIKVIESEPESVKSAKSSGSGKNGNVRQRKN